MDICTVACRFSSSDYPLFYFHIDHLLTHSHPRSPLQRHTTPHSLALSQVPIIMRCYALLALVSIATFGTSTGKLFKTQSQMLARTPLLVQSQLSRPLIVLPKNLLPDTAWSDYEYTVVIP